MMPLMCCQDIRPVECLVTLVTLKRPLACARYLMCFQMTRLGECVFTLIRFLSYEGSLMYCLLPCVGSLMSGQGNRPCKTLVTLVTFKRILSCMGSLMLCQVSRICECLITLVTLKRLLSYMDSLMLFQATRL